MKIIPVNIISGFLGSGKTTAIIKLLKQKPAHENWAIIINEFGKISIDSQIFKSNSEVGNVFEINGGCICCSAIQYLGETFDRIIEAKIYDRIIIEPSGLGGVDMISEIIISKNNLIIKPIICLVDLSSIGNKRLQINPIYRNQINTAKLIVFSKSDIINDGDKKTAISNFKELFPEKNNLIFRESLECKILDFKSDVPKGRHKFMFNPNENLSDSDYIQTSLRFDTVIVFAIEKLKIYFEENKNIIRAKGFLNTNNGWQLVNLTYSGVLFEKSYNKPINEIVIITLKSNQVSINNIKNDLIKKTAYIYS